MLNQGIFNVSYNIPLDINFYGCGNRNGEVKLFKKYVIDNIRKFKNVIFVADRLYFNYDLLDFLARHNLKYIIRVKGNGDNLNSKIRLNKNKRGTL